MENKDSKIIGSIKGGLVLGRSHFVGHIYMYFEDGRPHFRINAILPIQTVMQGGEYIINPTAVKRFQEEITLIYSSLKDNEKTENIILTIAKVVYGDAIIGIILGKNIT
jgi:hypothetical protein